MDAILKQKWIDALRSGRYHQYKTAFRSPDRSAHCCLGVLCEVAGWEISGNGMVANVNGSNESYTEMRDMGIPADHLYDMNDNMGFSFEKIADYIEKKL